MKSLNNSQADNIIAFGAKSKFAEFIFKYPWRAMIIAFILLEGITFSIDGDVEWLIKPVIVLLPFFIINTLFAQYFTYRYSYSYKVVIDKISNTIKFYLMFNRGIIEEEMRDVEVIVDNNCNIVIGDKKIAIFVEFIRKIVSHLPANTKVRYVGFFGRYKEKDWRKRNLLLKPGGGSTNNLL